MDCEAVSVTRADFLKSLGFILPILVIITFLMAGRSPALAGFWATVTAIVLGPIYPEFRKNPFQLLLVMREAGLAAAGILLAVAAIGIILGVLNLTGIGITFASLVGSFAGDNLVRGTLPYSLGQPDTGHGNAHGARLSDHCFGPGPHAQTARRRNCRYAPLCALFRRNVCVDAARCSGGLAAAPIAGAGPLPIALRAMGLALVGFAMPFAFVYNPQLLIIDGTTALPWIWAFTRVVLAVWLFAAAAIGWDRRDLGIWNRLLGFAVAVLLLTPDTVINLPALFGGAVLISWRRFGVWPPFLRRFTSENEFTQGGKL